MQTDLHLILFLIGSIKMKCKTQIAELAINQDLCQRVYDCFIHGQSVRHIARKYQISEYAVKKIVKFWREKDEREGEK